MLSFWYVFAPQKFFLMNLKINAIHPEIIKIPAIGVIGPNIDNPSIPIRNLVESKKILPEKSIVPNIKGSAINLE